MQKKYQILLLFIFAMVTLHNVNAQEITSSIASTEIPWGWYVSRVSGLLGFVMLYVSIFLGLTVRVPFLRKIFPVLYSLNMHCWISLQALMLAMVHGVALMFDKFINFGFLDVFIPFASSYKTDLVALGTISFYLMLLLVAVSYGRKYFSQEFWRATHYLSIGLYIIVFIHALYLGTDLKEGIVRNIFIYANVFLVFLMLINVFSRIKEYIIRKKLCVFI